jgi:Ca2+-binding EF-hand superfamily protein
MNRRGVLLSLLTGTGVAFAQKLTRSAEQDKFALANEDVKQLILLMDTDKSGKVSKQEWMNFMEAEFNRLDKDGSGELDVAELRQSSVSVKRSKS